MSTYLKEVELETTEKQLDEALRPSPIELAGTHKLVLGLVFGIVFGFLLQKGGVAKFHVLIGQLLLVDFTVVKIMLSAVIVGMIGIHVMHQRGMVELHLKPTKYLANTLGGLLFGVGFGLAAYCPGTGAAALGQGNFDAILMMLGMFGGSYLFALSSGWVSRNIDSVGDKGKITLHDWVPLDPTTLVLICAGLFTVVLIAIELLAVR